MAMSNGWGLRYRPLLYALAWSLGVHLALLGLVGSHPHAATSQTLVVHARLLGPATTPEVAEEPATDEAAAALEEAVQNDTTELTETPPSLAAAAMPEETGESAATPEQNTDVPQPAPSTQATAPQEPPPAPQDGIASADAASAPTPEERSLFPSLPIDTTWYLARQVDRHPKAIGSITPEYPEAARQRGQEGRLMLMLKIDDLGRVREAEVIEANPTGVFDESALQAFRAGRFEPAMKDGRPVRYQAYIRVEFKLDGPPP